MSPQKRHQLTADSLADPMDVPRYRSAPHAAFTIVREEGLATLYRGVTLTALRQATNQGWRALAESCAHDRRELHGISAVQEVGSRDTAAVSGRRRATVHPDDDTRLGLGCDGTVLQCARRYYQDVSACLRRRS